MLKRRSLLGWLATTPFALAFGSSACKNPSKEGAGGGSEQPETVPDSRAQLLHLCLVLGPWVEQEREEAEAFYRASLTDKILEENQADAVLIEKLWHKHKDSSMALDEVSAGSDEEFRVLSSLVAIAYASPHYLNEARFKAAGAPVPGVCQGAGWAARSDEG